jgi:hypothetical protein
LNCGRNFRIKEQKSLKRPEKKILGFIEAETMYIERGRKSVYKNVASSRGGWGRYSRPLINLLAPEGGGGGGRMSASGVPASRTEARGQILSP